MSLQTHVSGRGGRRARKVNAESRRSDRLKADGVLEDAKQIHAQAQAEAIICQICHKKIHPSNYNKHMRDDHPKGGKPLHETVERLPLAAICIDGGTQSRWEISQMTVNEYADEIQAGATFPALVVFFDGQKYWLADGFHRYHAAKLCGLLDFPADVRQGTVRDAILHSVGANAAHGLRRTYADKRRAVERLLRDDEWVMWSDREIARRCGVSHPFVSQLRKSLVTVTSETRTYTTKHGTAAVMQTGKIGKTTSNPTPVPSPRAGRGESTTQPHPLPPSPLRKEGERFMGGVTYGPEVDEYVEDVGDGYVDDVPAVEVDELTLTPDPLLSGDMRPHSVAASGEGEPLETHAVSGGLYEGAMVRATSGQTGRVIHLSGRIAIVETRNGQRPYDVEKLTLVDNPSQPHPLPPSPNGEGEDPSQPHPLPPSPLRKEGERLEQPFNYKRDAKAMVAADATVSQPFDFCQTPAYALDPLVKYLGWGHDWKIWEPAAGEMGLVEALYDSGWMEGDVIASDILTGQNFLEWTPDSRFDVIVTNPPYSLKFPWLKRCYELGKPFALLLPVDVLGSKTAQALMQEHGFEMMLLDSRVDFKMPNAGWDGAGAQFATFWLTWQVLPQQVMFGSIAEGKKAWNEHRG